MCRKSTPPCWAGFGVSKLFSLCTQRTEAQAPRLFYGIQSLSTKPAPSNMCPRRSTIPHRHTRQTKAYALRVPLLAPLVEPVVDILKPPLAPAHPRGTSRGASNLGERHAGNDNGVQGAGSLLGGLVLRERSLIPRHLLAVLLRLACNSIQLADHPHTPATRTPQAPEQAGLGQYRGSSGAIRTEVERGSGKGNRDTGTEGLDPTALALHHHPVHLPRRREARTSLQPRDTHESRPVASLGRGLLLRLVRQAAGGRGEESAGNEGGHFIDIFGVWFGWYRR